MSAHERKDEPETHATKPGDELLLDKQTLADLTVDDAQSQVVKGGGCSDVDSGCTTRTR